MINSRRKNSIVELVSRIRRNHALEHATIHVLSSQNPKTSIVGRSDSRGFILYSHLSRKTIEESVVLALDRLRAGEKQLAVHPNCGTNLLTSGVLSGAAAYFSIQGSDDRHGKFERLPLAIASAVMGLIIAQPLGMRIQKHLTTDPVPGSLEILSVEQLRHGIRKLYRVRTRT
jgi:hypothetical protein